MTEKDGSGAPFARFGKKIIHENVRPYGRILYNRRSPDRHRMPFLDNEYHPYAYTLYPGSYSGTITNAPKSDLPGRRPGSFRPDGVSVSSNVPASRYLYDLLSSSEELCAHCFLASPSTVIITTLTGDPPEPPWRVPHEPFF